MRRREEPLKFSMNITADEREFMESVREAMREPNLANSVLTLFRTQAVSLGVAVPPSFGRRRWLRPGRKPVKAAA
jgi:hypothetical protein